VLNLNHARGLRVGRVRAKTSEVLAAANEGVEDGWNSTHPPLAVR